MVPEEVLSESVWMATVGLVARIESEYILLDPEEGINSAPLLPPIAPAVLLTSLFAAAPLELNLSANLGLTITTLKAFPSAMAPSYFLTTSSASERAWNSRSTVTEGAVEGEVRDAVRIGKGEKADTTSSAVVPYARFDTLTKTIVLPAPSIDTPSILSSLASRLGINSLLCADALPSPSPNAAFTPV